LFYLRKSKKGSFPVKVTEQRTKSLLLRTSGSRVQSWQNHRNQRVGTVNWQFRTADARIKLKRLYPVQQSDAPPLGSVV
jgi:hypothetical protein